MAFFTSTTDLQAAQSEILRTSTAANPAFKAHAVAALDKSLKTTKKDFAGAINELKSESTANTESAGKVLDYMNTIVGSNSNATIQSILAELDSTVIEALYHAIQRVRVNEMQITDIQDNITSLNEGVTKYEQVEQVMSVTGDGEFASLLERLPNERLVVIDVNNVEYDENKHFTVNRETGRIVWTFTELNGGFDLEPDFFINCKFYTVRTQQDTSLT